MIPELLERNHKSSISAYSEITKTLERMILSLAERHKVLVKGCGIEGTK